MIPNWIIVWQCPSCEDLKDYHNTTYYDAMNILCNGYTDEIDVTGNVNRGAYEIRISKRDCYACK